MNDSEIRALALKPNHSFIVQAPAGSGKTELLTQRFLVLLALVNAPEEILAITFTRKSAAEMRARILAALQKADLENEPTTPHEKTTWNLARKVLTGDSQLNWKLLDNPNRLRIQTIDSLNASITKSLPILSNFGGVPEIIDDCTSLYREAVQEFLSHLEENLDWSNAIAELLIHLDNDFTKVEKLLMAMLAKRDQWLPYIINAHDNQEIRIILEKHLSEVVTDTLEELNKHFPKEHESELIALANYAATNLHTANAPSKIIDCLNLSGIPGSSLADFKLWTSLAELLLTREGEWRKRLDKNVGFLSASNASQENKLYFNSMKTRMLELIENLKPHLGFFFALNELNKLPAPEYSDSQWHIVSALNQILRVLIAQLKVCFKQHGQIDYIENSTAALLALGTDDNPTDLALALDYKIQHILVDEFQDTANNQCRLLEKLTMGWQDNDGRTLFLVGDPMQSIYRFREAEVGLFIKARKTGIDGLSLIPLTLKLNFRSNDKIIDWVNNHFNQVFPPIENIATGAVTFSESYPGKTQTDDGKVELHAFINKSKSEQANAILKIIADAKSDNPNGSIAILVRSRSHLNEIISVLKTAKLNYCAIDIDPLESRPAIQDLLSLTTALLFLNDRVAWLAILRAPWLGLSLNDLLLITGTEPTIPIWARLQDDTVLKSLSERAQKVLPSFLTILKQKIHDRRRYTFRNWIESTWLALGGPATLQEISGIEDVKSYFQLLEQLDLGGELKDPDQLGREVSRLYAAPNTQVENLQIMTIHTAKGLEFDTTIVPHLEAKSIADEKQLLLWLERPRDHAQNQLLLAPIPGVGEKNNLIYDYIKYQHAIKASYENSRLLYVAVTRAKKNLHLLFNLETKESNPKELSEPISNSLLYSLWPAIRHYDFLDKSTTDHARENVPKKQDFLNRLPANWVNPVKDLTLDHLNSFHNEEDVFILSDLFPQIQGTIIHCILQQISTFSINWWQEKTFEQKIVFINNQLKFYRINPGLHTEIQKTILTAIENTLRDPRALWIFTPHSEAKSEFAVTTVIKNKVKTLIVDRTFIDENTRWIIDYKTSHPLSTALDEFIKNEKEKYFLKMHEYASAIRTIDDRPIKLGLYFPLINEWHAWDFTN